MKIIEDFIDKVIATYKTGVATEHSYRSAIEKLFNSLADNINAINEPKRVACGAPDFIIQRGDVAIGHLEAKDLGVGLRSMKDANKNQQERYRNALTNLIYTNCLEWDFYRNGELVGSVTIADYLLGVQPNAEQYEKLENLLKDFIGQAPQPITSPRELALKMAGKAQLIKVVLKNVLDADKDIQSEISSQYDAFKQHLIHDITTSDFADIYAETIAYGMFAARLRDGNSDTFNRQEALLLLPKSNPFLRNLFTFVAGYNLDERISWIIDDLATIFQAADVSKIMKGFGRLTGRSDPFLHFYETFLAAYSPSKRKSRGVWYTPEAVVNFIVRSVNTVLENDFHLPDGLADTSKFTIDWDTGQKDNKGNSRISKKDVHRVQILDPATGTGTFLAEVIKQIAPKVKDFAPGIWSSYVEADLIPRLHGFELLMASYAMCHMKIDMILTEMGYKPSNAPPRLSVYLTNSLEEGEPANQTLPFAQWLSNEVKQANSIKRDLPIMCIIGNPPYSGESSNKGDWITGLMDAYKKEPGGIGKLQEKNTKWINKDEHKFIRMSEHLIEKTGEGVLGFISSHGYLDDPTIRGMRWHLLKTFDKIYIYDLHGNANKKEVTPDGNPDKNIFDIMQGVSIIIAVKIKSDSENTDLARVYHREAWGSRAKKYEELWSASISDDVWVEIKPESDSFYFKPFDTSRSLSYNKHTSVEKWFSPNGDAAPGMVTTHDSFAISWSREDAKNKIKDFLNTKDENEARSLFKLCNQSQWSYSRAKKELSNVDWEEMIGVVNYRPFDKRITIFNSNVAVHLRQRVTKHFLGRENIGLITSRMTKGESFSHAFVTDKASEAIFLSSKTGNNAFNFPLYLYPDPSDFDQNPQINLDPLLFKEMQLFAVGKGGETPNEIHVFDYIYGVLYCPDYRATYADFLKLDFPRIPWPSTPEEFWRVSEKGGELRNLHLMRPNPTISSKFPFVGNGDSMVQGPKFSDGKVWINSLQYFENVPERCWLFFIGGYQPAQKWLKDRKGRFLTFSELKHYQRLLNILYDTSEIMNDIKIDIK